MIAITAIFCATYFVAAVYLCRHITFNTIDLCYCSLTIAMTIVLESIQFPLPTGARIPLLSMLPLMLLSCYNYKLATFSGFVTGLLVLFIVPGWELVHWGQFFVEHMVCFSCIGFTGIFGYQNKLRLLAGVLLASLLKLCGHFLSGVLFFSQNAWGGWSAISYSFAYNVSQNVPLAVLCGIVVLSLPTNTIKAIFGDNSKKERR